jgi:hypothetical protein
MLGIGSGINCLMLAVEWQEAAKKIKPVEIVGASPSNTRE